MRKTIISISAAVMLLTCGLMYSSRSFATESPAISALRQNIYQELAKEARSHTPDRDGTRLRSITSIKAGFFKSLATVTFKQFSSTIDQCPDQYWSVCGHLIIRLTRQDIISFNSAFKSVFGIDIVSSVTPLDSRNSPFFVRYSAQGIQTAFNALYITPHTPYAGQPAKSIYDEILKNDFRQAAYTVKIICSEHEKLAQTTAAFKTGMSNTTSPFEGRLFEPPLLKSCMINFGNNQYKAERIAGMVIRRNIDGTLPVVTGIIDRILKDYDPEYIKIIEQDM